jgi:hypothetical protein
LIKHSNFRRIREHAKEAGQARKRYKPSKILPLMLLSPILFSPTNERDALETKAQTVTSNLKTETQKRKGRMGARGPKAESERVGLPKCRNSHKDC